MVLESIYDLAYESSNPEPGRPTILDIIRHEILTTFPPPSPFDKRISQRLYNLDAFLKETARLRHTGGLIVSRIVNKRNGWTTGDGLYLLPYNARIGFPGRSIHTDAEFYKRPEEHIHARFYR